MSKEQERRIVWKAGTSGGLTVRRRTEPAWPEQYELMRRMFGRAERPGRSQQEQLDDLMIFFQSAFHLVEWIRNDETLSVEIRQGIKDKVVEQDVLLICRDLAVGAKHFAVWPVEGRPKAVLGVARRMRRRTTRRLGGETKFIEEESSEPIVVLLSPEIEGLPEGEHGADFETRPAIGVAREVVAAWDEVLEDIGLRARPQS